MKKEVFYPMRRTGQAAFEFLVTYGWAFIIVLVVLGILAYFGVFSASQFTPERCDFGPQLECIDFIVNSQGYILLKFQNSFGDSINITGAQSYDFAIDSARSNTSMRLGNGRVETVRIKAMEGFAPKEKIPLNIRIFFRRDFPSSPIHNITGTIMRRVCAGTYDQATERINC
ncbi:MAG: hypothetical protein ABIJ21_00370 [Nanoarchaeota archaeon]